jgi:hypothetical protein
MRAKPPASTGVCPRCRGRHPGHHEGHTHGHTTTAQPCWRGWATRAVGMASGIPQVAESKGAVGHHTRQLAGFVLRPMGSRRDLGVPHRLAVDCTSCCRKDLAGDCSRRYIDSVELRRPTKTV